MRVVARSAPVLGLVAAFVAFFISTIRRRWRLEELRAIEIAGTGLGIPFLQVPC